MARILIVDDSNELLELFSYIFEMKGFEMKTAVAEKQIFDILTSFKPDIILMDVKLRDECGREICKKIKEDKNHYRVKIILISANRELLENYQHYKADDCMEKPFIMDELVTTINKYIPTAAT